MVSSCESDRLTGVPEDPKTCPRVLILSVNPLSASSNNGKTFASFFEGYPTDKLAQLYFHRELPSSDVCSNYFRISDEETLRFLTRRDSGLGAPVDATTKADQYLSPVSTRALASSPTVRLIRLLLLYLVIPRRHSKMDEWLKSFRPEIIFFIGGDATYLYPLADRISREHGAPIVTYITDDYVLPAEDGNVVSRLTRSWVRRKFLSNCRSSALVLTIGEKMSKVYANRFGIESSPIMNLAAVPSAANRTTPPSEGGAVRLCYAGGLHLRRWDTLAKIGASLDRLAGKGFLGELHIYTASHLDARMMNALSSHESVVLHESVDASELKKIYAEADLLVHVESFAPSDRTTTYLSISTKIPEYLVSGRSILAVGPADVASIEYVAASGAGFIATGLGEADLDTVIREAIGSPELRQLKAELALKMARKNHEAGSIRSRLWRDISEIAAASNLVNIASRGTSHG